MRYIITESRLNTAIFNYLDKTFNFDEINWHYPYDYNEETGEEGEDENRIEFYMGDFEEGDNVCFRWMNCEYFNPDSPAQNICPEVVVEYPYDVQLNGYFDDLWHEPFKKWFTERFDLPIKTVTSF